MPLLAYTRSGEPLVAPLVSDDEWERLRSAKDRDAWMPHSQRRAIPKISRLGTRFFAHPPGHAPEGAKESNLHLYLKAQCLIGAKAAGWEALPEQIGKTPEGLDWRADVLCRRPEKAWSVGFEAQVQLQGEEAYRQRQERYAASGLRTLWLVAHEPAALQGYWRKPDPHLPAFRTSLWKDPEGRPGAHVHVDGLTLNVADFVSGALSRQLQWYENGRHAVVTLVLREDQCWHRTCRRKILLAYKAETSGGEPIGIEAVQALEGYAEAYTRAQAALPNLADSPWLFRQARASRCPHCRREIRYQSYDPGRPRTRQRRVQDPYASASLRVHVPIGVAIPEQGCRPGLSPHAGWHWGPAGRWIGWASLGGIGLISHQRPAARARQQGLTRDAGDQLWLSDVMR
jgi:hypothetical protein